MSGTNQFNDGLTDEMLGDFLEPLDAGFSRPGADEVDDMLDVIAREVDGNQDMGPPQDRPRRGSNISLDLDPAEFEAFTESLEESLAKFDEFLERANVSQHGSEEQEDELTELRPIESIREKRSRDHGSLQSGSLNRSGMPSRIRNISGEKLSSMPAMHQGYATMSSLNKSTGLGSNSPQKNQTWDKPEPILGEVTGNKMRRLLSEQSYFQSRPAVATDASRNAPWHQPKTPTVSARTAMQTLLHGGISQGHSQATPAAGRATTSTTASWPAPKQSSGGVTMSQMQHSRATTSGFQAGMQRSGINQSAQVAHNTSKPAFASVSLQDMQRLAGAGATFPTQSATAGTSMPQNSMQAQTKTFSSQQMPTFAAISLQDMQRLANSGISFSSQGAASMQGGVGQTTMQTGGHAASAPKPTFATVSLQDMHRLAASGVAAPAQATHTAANSVQPSTMQPPKQPVFASVSLQDMQRLANSGPTFASQARAPVAASNSYQVPTPPWSTAQPVTVGNMHSLTNTTSSFSNQAVSTQASGNAVPTPPWAVQAQKPAAAPTFAQNVQQSVNPMSGSFSFDNITQASAAPKPVFGTVSVSLEDMQRLASTGVTHPTVPIAPAAGTQGTNSVAQNAPWNVPKPSNGTQSTVTSTQQAAPPKPTFASVTLEDMQRLVNAYSEHQKPAQSTAQPKETPIAPKPVSMVSVENMNQAAAVGRTESVSRGNAAGGGDNVRVTASLPTAHASKPKDDNVVCIDSATPPKKVSGGSMQQMLSDEFQPTGSGINKPVANTPWPDAVASKAGIGKEDDGSVGSESTASEDLEALPSDPDEMLTKLRKLMDRSSSTQQALQDFDKQRGLPRSHSQTMVNSSRSRKQLLEGKIIAKWDGSPLISEETELGKPRPRMQNKKTDGTQQNDTDGDTGGTTSTAFAAV